MDSSLRRDPRALIEALESDPHRFHVLQAVRLLERLRPRALPAGVGTDAREEAVRFHSRIAGAFPASDIERLDLAGLPERPAEMSVNFLGLAGAFGPLPAPISELAIARARAGDTAVRDFLDIFNHRLVSLFCRLHRAARVVLQPGPPAENATAGVLYAILGLGTGGLRRTLPPLSRERMAGADRSLLAPAGLLARRPSSLHALERLVAHHLSLPVRAWPVQGRWLPLDPDQQTALGRRGRNRALGRNAVLGRRVWDQQAAVRFDIGPMPLARALPLLPGGQAHPSLASLLDFALGGRAEASLRLILAAAEVPTARLARGGGSRLGWTSWLGSRPRTQPGVVSIRLALPGGAC